MMENRFKRAFRILNKEMEVVEKEDYEVYMQVLYENKLDTRWLRNSARLWEDYKEDPEWSINGVNHDPNHPDNLSHSVYQTWKFTKGNYNQ